ncbi:MAG: TetR family transcriptional regulator [Acidimicrobiia bacterium]|nr:TetR family transcriptional regulator [Acidimicrobiia bacterium]
MLQAVQTCIRCTPVAQTVDRRARKKRETFRALATAARELTLERGLECVTVEDIANAADVSVRTFFNYFSSKEEAIIGVEPSVVAALGAELEARPAEEDPLTALLAVLVSDTEELPETARRWQLRAELVRRYPSLLPRHLAGLVEVERALVSALAARLGVDPERDLYPTLVVTSAVAVLRSTLAWWHDNDRPLPLADALRDAFATLATGVANPPATT